MTIFGYIACFILGILVGRLYGWMKYHYPEFQEAIKMRAARYRAERMRYEAEAERYRGAVDDEIDRRMLIPPPKPSDSKRSVTRP